MPRGSRLAPRRRHFSVSSRHPAHPRGALKSRARMYSMSALDGPSTIDRPRAFCRTSPSATPRNASAAAAQSPSRYSSKPRPKASRNSLVIPFSQRDDIRMLAELIVVLRERVTLRLRRGGRVRVRGGLRDLIHVRVVRVQAHGYDGALHGDAIDRRHCDATDAPQMLTKFSESNRGTPNCLVAASRRAERLTLGEVGGVHLVFRADGALDGPSDV